MRLLIFVSLCLTWSMCQAQNIHSKVGLQTIYIPQFAVQEASDSNVQAIGLRWILSDYDLMLFEFGFHAYTGYSEVGRASLGFNIAYLFTERKSHDFKIGLSLSKIDLEDVEINEKEFGSHVGDVSFTSWGNEFKPYLEWEWTSFQLSLCTDRISHN
ncbi:MAG TPA: hypothetical protein VK074_07245 [Fodinibius sp.]|nr:hypothetical protein [Fodinibius sp.]